ncbi:MAG: DUF1116 domain-containing protein, partial [Candidatus Cloacimonadaceae bacterium]|nr:DUF1116 domain-containing protein [Candidatus Cloacimonadaceae bacterium]
MKLDKTMSIINIGLEAFKEDLELQGYAVIQIDWHPPAQTPFSAFESLESRRETIEAANQAVMKILQQGKASLIGLDLAKNVIPGMHDKLILHAGPPITWERMCGPMRGAVIGALIYEGLASDPSEAEQLAASDEIQYAPCHDHSAVGPMAGIISASMPVYIVRNESFGNEAYCTLNEGLGKVLRYGAFSAEVIDRLRWMQIVLYPVLKNALKLLGRIDLSAIISQALHMGDEVHNRNRAATSLLIRQLAPAVLRSSSNIEDSAAALEFINGNDHSFLNLSMPACKAILDAAKDVPHSSIAIAMARNGTDFGIKLAGRNQWFTGKALVPEALFFPGYTIADANPDIGDSAITETGGLGGFAIAAAPAIVQFVGGNAADAL